MLIDRHHQYAYINRHDAHLPTHIVFVALCARCCCCWMLSRTGWCHWASIDCHLQLFRRPGGILGAHVKLADKSRSCRRTRQSKLPPMWSVSVQAFEQLAMWFDTGAWTPANWRHRFAHNKWRESVEISYTMFIYNDIYFVNWVNDSESAAVPHLAWLVLDDKVKPINKYFTSLHVCYVAAQSQIACCL